MLKTDQVCGPCNNFFELCSLHIYLQFLLFILNLENVLSIKTHSQREMMTVIYILWTGTSEIPLRVLELENLYRWGLPVEIVLSGITTEPVTEDKTHAPLLPGFP